jgi:hypothetical protein
MNENATTTATWEMLLDLGFQPGENKERFYDFGDYKLFAGPPGLDWRRAIHAVPFHGGWTTHRTWAWVEFDLPIEMESREQCTAFLAYYLDRYNCDGCFNPKVPTPWLDLVGRVTVSIWNGSIELGGRRYHGISEQL